mmetsp:Transcript_12155/g.36111  ORF Transcript_12155/g.36111 Transcript_12155/m.36111 type:complete len:566 (-) Transcript_12155:235-1932(-)
MAADSAVRALPCAAAAGALLVMSGQTSFAMGAGRARAAHSSGSVSLRGAAAAAAEPRVAGQPAWGAGLAAVCAAAAAARRGAVTGSRTSLKRTARTVRSAAATKEKGSKQEEGEAEDGALKLEPPSGTRDFYPAEMRQQRWLFDKFREVAKSYGFAEYDAPVLEHEELYKRKAGEEITQQMYNFVDKEGAAVTLRPEMTPSLARMVLSLMRLDTGEVAALLPLKWYSIPQCWRFETTQRGRKREHYQWNMDIVGVSTIYAEAELLSAVCAFFESIGITSNDVGLKVNSRKVLGAVMKKAGVPDDRFAETCVIIDKLDKIGADEVKKQMKENVGLSEETAQRIVAATGAKTLDEFATIAGVGESEEVKELRKLFELAADYGYGDWLQFDASVVRGLAYYTGVVFEGFDKAGVLRAICGGGRYDRLLTLYGSPKEIPCCGFGFGDCVIIELLKEKGVLQEFPSTVEYVVAAYNDDMMGPAMKVAHELRKAGKTVDVFLDVAKRVKKAFKYADKVGGEKIAFVAPDEWENGTVRIKALRGFPEDATAEDKQKDVPFADLANVDSYFKR